MGADSFPAEEPVLGPGISEAVEWAGLVVAEARGMHLIRPDGSRVTDLMGAAGVNLLGHSHPGYVRAMAGQLQRWMIGAHGSDARRDMGRQLQRLLPEQLNRIQLYSSGSEAVEAALRLAKSATGRYEILSFWQSFHGRTMGSLAHTSGARNGLGPPAPGSISAPYADCARCPLRLSYPSCDFACVDLARDVLREQSSGALAAVLVEPVQGRAGNVSPPAGYLARLRQLADEHGALLIADESMTGMGRTGEVFASDHPDVRPDIMVLGKGLGNGYPVSAVCSSLELMERGPFGAPSASSSSYGGFPLACRAVAVVAETVREQGLAGRARLLGERLLARLSESLVDLPLVAEVRGRGLAIGIELDVADKGQLRHVFQRLLSAGVLVMTGGRTLRLYPPLTADETELMAAADTLSEVLRRHWDGQ
ncbi:4-aminobutyrate aminotransferase/4-aminobutyrate aminotransferase/(S)-3-amino-2-methylpropionate transaminase [Micromonospora sp. Llam0]|uniref:aspartate aminotransferase family protein n=1 Tax=Micromonospora sp. Llam0 TaxID=2485143 RepID=UPI000F49310E|nr:aspartate aminotransferase family protein [Micromonospora sp. Llam0]ROO62547.1 4-aminobutyrate aminotransferase/4-aminobutyrate aminotransferase/(S)-3-amino-2-methylpropionate transaminase [Micromonospora sp. Llam0]